MPNPTPAPRPVSETPLPCPFCGQDGVGTVDGKYVYCYTTGCAMYAKETDAIAWNRRAAVDGQRPQGRGDAESEAYDAGYSRGRHEAEARFDGEHAALIGRLKTAEAMRDALLKAASEAEETRPPSPIVLCASLPSGRGDVSAEDIRRVELIHRDTESRSVERPKWDTSAFGKRLAQREAEDAAALGRILSALDGQRREGK